MESSSSSSDFLGERVGVAHEISQGGDGKASVLECLHTKVNELLQYKQETYSLRAQLKIAEETIAIQTSEFSFQKKQLEEEIAILKDINDSLRETITKLQKQRIDSSHRYDVQVTLECEKAKVNQLLERVQDWKGKATSAQENVKLLQEKLAQRNGKMKKMAKELESNREAKELLAQELESAKTTHEKLRAEVSKLKKALKEANLREKLEQARQEEMRLMEESSSSSTASEEVMNENVRLQAQLETSALKIEKQERAILDLEAQISTINEQKQREINKLMREIEKLRASLQNTAKKVEKAKELQEKLDAQSSLIDHIELEKDAISDLLDIDSDALAGKWHNMAAQIERLIENSAQADALRRANEKLKKRLDVALEELQRPVATSHPQKEEDDGLVRTLQTSLHQAKSEVDVLTKQLQKMKERAQFAGLIGRYSSEVTKQLGALHDSVFARDKAQMRTLVLAVLFAKRMIRVYKSDAVFDPRALLVFSGKEEESADCKIRDLRGKFTEITQDLLVAKQDLLDTHKHTREVEDKATEIESKNSDNETLIKIGQGQVASLKARLLELQQELSTLVPPERYQDLEKRMEIVQTKNQALETEIEHLKSEIKQRTKMIRDLSLGMEEMAVKARARTKSEKKMRVMYTQKEEELESLQSLLREKTKEVLALERLVTRQRELEKTAETNFNCLAVENRQLQQQVISSQSDKHETGELSTLLPNGGGIMGMVNPAFLG